MDDQRPPVPPSPDDEPEEPEVPETSDELVELPPDEQPTRPIERVVPPPEDAQPTQELGSPPPPVSGVDENAERMVLLRRLSPAELFILRQRLAGATASEIGAAMGTSATVAATHLGNVYDKLGITYGSEGTSYSRLMEFGPLLDAPGAPVVPPVVRVRQGPLEPIDQPTQRAMQLSAADDQALLAQVASGGPPPPGDKGPSQGWIIGGVLAFILLAALLAFFLFARDDDDDNGDATPTPAGQSTEVIATATPESAATPEAPTATLAPEEPTATPEPPTATPEPTATEVPPTETPEPTATATEEPEPTATEEPEPTATEAAVTPVPVPGQLAYEANWSGGAADWQLTDGWTAENGALVADGAVALPLLSPFQPPSANYAVEAQLALANLDQCNTVAGAFAHVVEQSNIGGTFPAGYIGGACADGWRIDAVQQISQNRDTLAEGEFALDDQPHVYRLEVQGEQIRLFIDGAFVGETTDDRWPDAGGAGIYLSGPLQVTVSAFRVFTLP